MSLSQPAFGWLRDGLGNLAAAQEIEGKLSGFGQQDWFVDSGAGSDSGSFDGKSWKQPFATIDYAIGKTTASNGDRIIVKPGHAETIDAASAITCDVVGIEIIGVGRGTDRPTLTWDATASTIVMSAANVTWRNFHFINTVDAMVVGFPVTAAHCGFANCLFDDATAAENTLHWITLSAAADYFELVDCDNHGTDTAGNTAFITMAAADHVKIVNLKSHGDFAAANIDASAAPTDILIEGCKLENINAVDVNIELFSAATGWIVNNSLWIATDGEVTWINTPGNTGSFENYGVNDDGEAGMIAGVVSQT